MVNLEVFDHLGPLWTLLDHLKRFKWFFARKHLRQILLCPYGATNWFLSEMVQKCPDRPKKVQNFQKHLGFPFRTLLDPFGPLWNVDKPAMLAIFVCLIGAFFGDTLYLTKVWSKWLGSNLFPKAKRDSSGRLLLWLRYQDIATCSDSAYLRCLILLHFLFSSSNASPIFF